MEPNIMPYLSIYAESFADCRAMMQRWEQHLIVLDTPDLDEYQAEKLHKILTACQQAIEALKPE